MSETEHFAFLGPGNGFTTCLDKVDVGPYDAWTTLGGYNKEALDAETEVTQVQIDLSERNAQKLFWNLERVVGNAEAYADKSNPPTAAITELNIPTSPKDRVCDTEVNEQAEDSTGGTNTELAKIWAHFTIVKMYDGETLLGYGMEPREGTAWPIEGEDPRSPDDDATGIGVTAQWWQFSLTASVSLQSMVHHVTSQGGFDDPADEVAYIEMSGIHFIGYASFGAGGGNIDPTIPSSDFVDIVPRMFATITSLEFFTYPE